MSGSLPATDSDLQVFRSTMKSICWGSSCKQGGRSSMEDAISVYPNWFEDYDFFGIFDGHGGSEGSLLCSEQLHIALVDELKKLVESSSLENRWTLSLNRAFARVDQLVTSITAAGSTALVAVIYESGVIVANTGDSSAVLARGKELVPLSLCHKPDLEEERARIEAAGGFVFHHYGCYRVQGVLAMSRSIGRQTETDMKGDRDLKPFLIPDPGIRFIARAKEDDFLILATDGLWDVMTIEEACLLARRRILMWHRSNPALQPEDNQEVPRQTAAQAAAEFLSTRALQKGSHDNISVIVVDFKPQRKVKTRVVA